MDDSGVFIDPSDKLLVNISSVNVAPFKSPRHPMANAAVPQLVTPLPRLQFNNPISYLGGPKLDKDQKKEKPTRSSIESVLSLD